MKRYIIIAGAVVALAGCKGAPNAQTSVYAAANALAAADNVAITYVTLPLCSPTHPAPLCSTALISGQIKSDAQKAHDAVKAAELAGDSASLAVANAAISLLVNDTPKTN